MATFGEGFNKSPEDPLLGCVMNPNFVAVDGLILKLLLVAEATPLAAAVKV